jgi:hypothetical protein
MQLLRGLVFYPLLWLRDVVVLLTRVVSVLAMMAAVAVGAGAFFTHRNLWLLAGVCAICSFLAFLLQQLYDSLLFRLNPTGRTLILYR